MNQTRSPILPAVGAVLAVGLIAAVLLWLFSLSSAVRLERSAFGFDGLTAWLQANDIDARNFAGGGQLDSDGIGLRILPLMDDNVMRVGRLDEPNDPYLRGEVRQIWEWVIADKTEHIPTLIVLPKWRDGVRLGGVIHPDFLLPDSELVTSDGDSVDAEEPAADTAEPDTTGDKPDALADWEAGLYVETDDMIRIDSETSITDIRRVAAQAPYEIEAINLSGLVEGRATLYAPQYAQAPQQCRAMMESSHGGLLFSCASAGTSFWVLSDPDLLNNHGLARGTNAELAIALIRELASDGSVLIDYSTAVWARPEANNLGRSWADLMRYFEPPFAWLWLAGLLFFAILIWRGGVRGVPLVRRFTEGHGAARMTALSAQARLLRQARADGALLKALRASYLHTLAERTLGRNNPKENRQDRVVRVLRHRDASAANDLEAALVAVDQLPHNAGKEQALPVLARLQSAYKKALKLT
ncbi:hypothetical protein [Hyphobacterium sp.]|uniref:hypothetical protein n=1 Tax=Hyphobacterium sp. TaxID=2004662 RepID=UPI003BAD1D44